MRVEITEKVLRDQDAESGKGYEQFEGDVITVPDELGKKWLGLGWAKDVDGVHPTGERKPGAQELVVSKATHKKGVTANG